VGDTLCHTAIIISNGGLLKPEGITHTVIIISNGGLLRPEGITHRVIIISDGEYNIKNLIIKITWQALR
jgi:hypothetical protein